MAEQNFVELTKEFSYVYDSVSINHKVVNFWISIPDFAEELRRLRKGKKRINDARFLRLMRKIYKTYDDLKKNKKPVEGFWYQQARKNIKALAEIIEGERSLYGKTE